MNAMHCPYLILTVNLNTTEISIDIYIKKDILKDVFFMEEPNGLDATVL